MNPKLRHALDIALMWLLGIFFVAFVFGCTALLAADEAKIMKYEEYTLGHRWAVDNNAEPGRCRLRWSSYAKYADQWLEGCLHGATGRVALTQDEFESDH